MPEWRLTSNESKKRYKNMDFEERELGNRKKERKKERKKYIRN